LALQHYQQSYWAIGLQALGDDLWPVVARTAFCDLMSELQQPIYWIKQHCSDKHEGVGTLRVVLAAIGGFLLGYFVSGASVAFA
jgi:hypothetical protein